MKNLLLPVIMIFFFGTVAGQTTKGSWVFGLHNFNPVPLSSNGFILNVFPQTNALGISFGTSKEKVDGEDQDFKDKTTVFGLSLNSHYFVADDFAVGLVGNFSSSSSKFTTSFGFEEKSSATLFLIGPEARYYFDGGEKTKVWLKGGASVGSIASKSDGETNDPYQLFQWGGGGGLSIFPARNVSIDLGLGYNVLTASETDNSIDEKSINSGLTFDVGVGIFLEGKVK